MEAFIAALISQGGPWLAVAGLILALGAVWKSRESLLARREEDLKVLYAALNASTNAQEEVAEVVKANTAQFSKFSELAALRAQAFDDFTRRTEASFARLEK